MLDWWLDWGVIALPILFGILPMIVEPHRVLRRKGSILVSGFVLALLILWQQSRASARAKDERQQLQEQVASLVRAEIKSGSTDLRGLRDDFRIGLQAMRDDLSGLKTQKEKAPTPSGVVSRKTIPFEPLPPASVSDIRYTERRTDSPFHEWPYGLQVILQTAASMQPTSFRIEFTDLIAKGSFYVSGQTVTTDKRLRTEGNVFFLSFGSPPFTPEWPVVVTVFAGKDIRVKSINRLRQ
ncbi:MAG: hypothetical protein ABI693_08465 [Bryobacteraceae bacterium]